MQRITMIERVLRQVYGEQPTDDSNITINLVNQWLIDAVALAAKTCYRDSIEIDVQSYVNGGFYTTFSSLPIIQYDEFTYRITLPQIPIGLGKNEGIKLSFLNSHGHSTYSAVPLSQDQLSFRQLRRRIPDKILFWAESIYLYIESVIPLTQFTGVVKMISGGDPTDLTSILNIPDDYIPVVIEYLTKNLLLQRAQKKDAINDGSDTT